MAQTEKLVWSVPLHNSPPSSGDEEEVTEVKQYQNQNTVPREPNTFSDNDWKTGVENTITGLSDSLCLMNESLQTLFKSNEKK